MKYILYRSLGSIDKDVKKHEIVGVEFGDSIDDVADDLIRDAADDLAALPEYENYVTDYLNTYKLSPHDLAMKIILDVLETTGITATAGIGTNLFLCKVAMDIVAKHIPADENGVRIAELDEMSYRKTLWAHQPLTDFWRVGRGIAKKLEENGMFTMGDVARCSVHDEDKLYKLFGKNAELLIDHAWGWEPTIQTEYQQLRLWTSSASTIRAG